MADKIILAFDVYGTLLDPTGTIQDKLSSHCGSDKAPAIAASWRKLQLEYTWRLNSMGQYQDFSHVTLRSLRNALAESSVKLDDKAIDDLMHAYDSLGTFPDVIPALEALRQEQNIHPVLFSNGTHDMISRSIHQSPDLKGISSLFKEIVVVEAVKRYKPAPEVYAHLARTVGKDPDRPEAMGSIWLVSGNPFDIVGARSCGLQAAWVDRAGYGWQDALADEAQYGPTVIVQDLGSVLKAVQKRQ